jgi:hypothetical protein
MASTDQRLINPPGVVYMPIVYPQWLVGFVHACLPTDIERYRKHYGENAYGLYDSRTEAAEARRNEIEKLSAVPGATDRAAQLRPHWGEKGNGHVTHFLLARNLYGSKVVSFENCYDGERAWFIKSFHSSILGEYQSVEETHGVW